VGKSSQRRTNGFTWLLLSTNRTPAGGDDRERKKKFRRGGKKSKLKAVFDLPPSFFPADEKGGSSQWGLVSLLKKKGGGRRIEKGEKGREDEAGKGATNTRFWGKQSSKAFVTFSKSRAEGSRTGHGETTKSGRSRIRGDCPSLRSSLLSRNRSTVEIVSSRYGTQKRELKGQGLTGKGKGRRVGKKVRRGSRPPHGS